MTFTPLDPDTVAADLRPPPLADLARRARRRTLRRRAAGAAALTATIAAAVVVAAPFERATEPEPPAVTHTGRTLPGPPERHLFTVPFTPTFALSVGQTGCAVYVQLTGDAGTTWTPALGPPPPETCPPGDDLTGQVSYTILDADSYRLTVVDRTWFTTDAGRTWVAAPTRDRVVDAFPPGRPGTSATCFDGCERPRAVDPGTGGPLALRNRPPFTRLTDAVWADEHTIWAVSRPDPGGRHRASISEDFGRTWSAPVDLPATDGSVTLVAASAGRAYLTWLTGEPRFAVYRTDDGGRTWTELDLPVPFPNLTMTGSRELMVLDSGPTTGTRAVWTSADGGGTFTGPMPLDIPAPMSIGVVPGLAMMSGEDRVLHVNDGTGWSTIRPPR